MSRKRISKSNKDLIDRIYSADLAKLHSEVNQLRNQEFAIPSFALAFIGAILKDIDYSHCTPLLIILGLMYYWHHTITIIRTRITYYLILRRASFWEIHYRKFADDAANRIVGQKKLSFISF